MATLSPINARFELRNHDLVRHLKCLEKNYMDFENIYLFIYLFIYFETNGKMHCKERHHTEGAKGPGEDKATSTKA